VTTIRSLAPVLPVADLDAATEHYRRLGFAVEEHDGPERYAFAERDAATVHLAEVANHDPQSSTSSVYLYVDEADALFVAWSANGIGGRTVAPVDTPYGLREGAHVDLDGNLLRFGAPLVSTAAQVEQASR
jgi:hypothetical protein